MTQEEKILFQALTEDRRPSAYDLMHKPAFKGIRDGVTGKYVDQAHFVYELLQNADDVGAENARFIILKKYR